MPPKDNQLKQHHWTKIGKQPVTYCTVYKTWHYDHDGVHFAKDHSAWKNRNKNRNRNKNKTTPTAAVTTQEDEDEDQTSDEEEDD
eukprot:13369093-Ditylum_brightwellii.AAC.1